MPKLKSGVNRPPHPNSGQTGRAPFLCPSTHLATSSDCIYKVQIISTVIDIHDDKYQP
jgi:hypothetical protein